MKAEFKTEEDLLKLCIEPQTKCEQEFLKEYMQKEIPGYQHSHQFEYDPEKNNLKTYFAPIINKENLLKEGFTDDLGSLGFKWDDFIPISYNGERGRIYVKKFKEIFLVINTFGGFFHYDNKGNFITGQFRNIYQVRNYINANREVWLVIPQEVLPYTIP